MAVGLGDYGDGGGARWQWWQWWWDQVAVAVMGLGGCSGDGARAKWLVRLGACKGGGAR